VRNSPGFAAVDFAQENLEKPGVAAMVLDGCALSSVVEHYLHTVGVAGSKPAARTIFPWFSSKDFTWGTNS
jgi:hypothetical protein